MLRGAGPVSFDLADGAATGTVLPARVVIGRAVVLNVLNPKVTIFFFAFLPQFLPGPAESSSLRLVGLGAVFMALTLATFLLFAWASAALRRRVARAPLVVTWVQRGLGALIVGFAARLALADR